MKPEEIRSYLKGNLTINEKLRNQLIKNINELSDSDLEKVLELFSTTSLNNYGHYITNISREGRKLNVALEFSITLIE